MGLPKTSLADADNALSHLHFAVSEELKGMTAWGVTIGYHAYPGMGLYVEIEARAKYAEQIAARLSHGVLWGEYDYRFSVSRELSDDPDRYVKIAAYPKTFEHREPLASALEKDA